MNKFVRVLDKYVLLSITGYIAVFVPQNSTVL